MRRLVVLALFLLSGAAALCYEVAWTRHLVLVFGNTTRAVSLILGAYMLGLALGSAFGGRLADRTRRPVLWYAIFEAAIGAYALAFPALSAGMRTAYLGVGTAASPVLFAGAFLLLLVPTFLMGTTLPLLVRGVVRDATRTGREVGLLYGANILGAVLGTAATGFLLMESAGVLGATRWAAATNVLIGVAGVLVSRRTLPAPALVAEAAAETASGSRAARAALLAAFSGGLVGLAAEVLWTRLLVFTLQGFTYTFSAMLATFLLGLAAGGFFFGPRAARSRDPAAGAGRLLVAVGVAAAAVLLVLTFHYPLSAAVWDWAGGIAGREDLRLRHVVMLLLASAIVLVPPAFLMGGTFPFAAAAYRRGLDDLGARIGRLYAVNTVGAVLGSLLAGFVLAPLAGPTWGAAVVSIAAIAAGAGVLALSGVKAAWRAPALAAAAAGALLWAADPSVPFLQRSHVFAGERAREVSLLHTASGVVCQVSVVENERERYRLLYTDEFEAAGTKPEYRYMRMLAHLPVALARDPSRVLLICWGTGTTGGSVAAHSAVRRMDVVEISPEVLEAAHYFRDVNHGIVDGDARPGLEVVTHVDDGRNFVLRSREQWGVITLEPLMPYTPAAIHLYTEDFYRECAPRLEPGGVMCQWIPLQAMSREHLRQVVAAFVRVFPDSAMFFVDGVVALIGGNEPLLLAYAPVAERLADPRVREDLAAAGFDDPVRALATFVAGGERLRAFAFPTPDSEPVTDEHPVLEWHPIPPRVVLPWLGQNVEAMRELLSGYPEFPVDLAGVADRDAVEERLFRAFRSSLDVLEGSVALEIARIHRARRDEREWLASRQAANASFARAVSVDATSETARRAYEGSQRDWNTLLAANAMNVGDLDLAERHFRAALGFRALRQEDVAWTGLAEALNRAERFEEALEAASRAVRLHPRGLEPRAERAYARSALGDVAGAAEDYRVALAGDAPAVLPAPRLVQDAERVLASAPAAPARDLAAEIESALAGTGRARVPAPVVLRILAADEPAAFARHFAPDLSSLEDGTAEADARLRAVARLRAAVPDGAVEALSRVTADARTPEPVRAAAADAIADIEPIRIADLLDPEARPSVLAAVATAAAHARERGVVDRLLPLLTHEDVAVRRAAHRAVFASTGAGARLDPDVWPSRGYLSEVENLRAWWARNQDTFDFQR